MPSFSGPKWPAIVVTTSMMMVGAFACDPDLTVATKPGTGGDGGVGDGSTTTNPSNNDASTTPTDDSGGGSDSSTPEQDTGAPITTGHKIDGTNDFAPAEKLLTSSSASGYEAYVAWDAQRVYFGMSGPDIGSQSASKWVLIYLGVPGTPGGGTKTGINYGGLQQPTLPFDATHHLRWKASGNFTTIEVFEGGAWKASNPALVPLPNVAQQGAFMEMSIVRSAIGATGLLDVHINMLIEGGGNDWTYAGVPFTSFTDGKNPTPFTKYFEFDLNDVAKAPSTYVAK